MKENVQVSLVQFSSEMLAPERNAERMAELVLAEAGRHHAELVVFPELSNTGYVRSARDDDYARRLYAASETVPGPTTERLAAAARQSGAHVVAGISQRHPRIPELLYNAAVLIDPSGAIVGVQHKVHACRDEKEYYVPGDRVATYPTALGRIGLQLCYDVRFPELARVQALDGAEIILSLWAAAVQPGRVPEGSIIARCATRAMENALFFAGCNRTGTDDGQVFFGHSAIAGPDGSTLAASGSDREESVRATLVAERLSAQRRYLTLFRDRRPDLYAPITAPLSDPATTLTGKAST
ncbi:hypothetical protein Ssi03_75850 [Sphaerisporangium siamense]|uniref:Putative amidohydrolase n=1 Tax=Sphaerisporangium siamense TaxID=795645 RepID=A0A7W7G8D5_9ACTN|nr:carbon-nitrogen hydrolase family protein [Sphaerisporangium siamense]MBB4699400.1 putative amidohydrolase [Sphaerisporangium siamense]GII89595.1 hypothetical protein Ssi03_75850 [Sphaerisporangium siamense]